MCTYQGRNVLQTGDCVEACQGCTFTNTVTATTNGSSCTFSWRVERDNCLNSPGATWSGTTTVSCGNSTSLSFTCDPGGDCVGYMLTLTAHDCP